jgi:hypothetical protein
MAAVVRVFMAYSVEIAHAVADPLNGLPSRLKWPPTIAEIREACDARVRPAVAYVDEWEQRSRLQLEERLRLEHFKGPKETLEETKADMIQRGFKWGGKVEITETADQVCHKFGITTEQWDAIPDLPADFEVTCKAQR